MKQRLFVPQEKQDALLLRKEHQINGGLGDAVIACACKTFSRADWNFVAVKDSFGESGKPEELLKKYGLDTPDIIAAAELVMSRKRSVMATM